MFPNYNNKMNCAAFALILLTALISYRCESVCVKSQGKNRNLNQATDIDGNVYKSIQIGKQIWMAENLRTTKYNDGTPIPNITGNIEWAKDTLGGYCFYNNSSNLDSTRKFGALYNWYAIKTGKLSPSGWRVPTDEDWTVLENYLMSNGYNYDGTRTGNKIAKALAATTDWDTLVETGAIGDNLLKNNKSGFLALPSGCRLTGRILESNFEGIGKYAHWWSSTEAMYEYIMNRELGCGNDLLRTSKTNCKICGFSVRLVKDGSKTYK